MIRTIAQTRVWPKGPRVARNPDGQDPEAVVTTARQGTTEGPMFVKSGIIPAHGPVAPGCHAMLKATQTTPVQN